MLGIAFWTSVNDTLFSCSQIHRRLPFQKFERKATSEPKVHIFNVFLFIILGQSSQDHQIIMLQSFLHRPFCNSTISTNTDKTLTLPSFAFADPLNIPNSIRMFILRLSILGDWRVWFFPNIIDWNRSIWRATCD